MNKRIVGALVRALLVTFLHGQKMKALGRVITVNLVYDTRDKVANINIS